MLALFRVTVTGLENIPTPPFIIAANHQAWFDPAFIIPFFPEAPVIYTMAKRETVFNREWKRRLLPLVGVFPISPERGELDEAGLRTVYQVLDRGGVVLIFPEGRYSRGRALRPLKVGIGLEQTLNRIPICQHAKKLRNRNTSPFDTSLSVTNLWINRNAVVHTLASCSLMPSVLVLATIAVTWFAVKT